MKYSIISTTVIALALSSQLVFAGEITDTYTAGDTLTATTLDNIKTAVNDNDATKQNRVTGLCATGSSISVINADGTVSCELDTDTDTTYSAGNGINISGTSISLGSGSVSISHHAFTNSLLHGCTFVHIGNYAYFSDGGWCVITDGDSVTAPVQLPDGVLITSVTCNVLDNTTLGQISEVSMYANYVESTSTNYLFIADSDGTDTGSTGPTGLATVSDVRQKVGDTDIGHRVNNYNNAYFIVVNFTHTSTTTFADTGHGLSLAGCRIDYTP